MGHLQRRARRTKGNHHRAVPSEHIPLSSARAIAQQLALFLLDPRQQRSVRIRAESRLRIQLSLYRLERGTQRRANLASVRRLLNEIPPLSKKFKAKPAVIGWKETIDFPDWGIRNILAKSDTGARRSAIDVSNLTELPGNKVQFDVVVHRKQGDLTQTVVCDIAHQTHVRSSNGQVKERYFVETTLKIGESAKKIELSLVSRKHMVCRVLLGRKALEGDFLVDSSAKYLTGPRWKPKIFDYEI